MTTPEKTVPGGDGAGWPTREELEKLPRWARVAFAARCARRVQVLFTHFWPQAPKKYVNAIDTAIALATSSARQSREALADFVDVYDDRTVAAVEVDDAAHDAGNTPARTAAESAGYAYGAARYIEDHAVIGVSRASTNAVHAASAIGAEQPIVNAMRHDFELLSAIAAEEKWTDATGVDVNLMGPLWPQGRPKGWPEDRNLHDAKTAKPHGIHLEFSVPAGADEKKTDRIIGEILKRANELHLAFGGSGLHVSGAKVYEPARVEEPIGGGS